MEQSRRLSNLPSVSANGSSRTSVSSPKRYTVPSISSPSRRSLRTDSALSPRSERQMRDNIKQSIRRTSEKIFTDAEVAEAMRLAKLAIAEYDVKHDKSVRKFHTEPIPLINTVRLSSRSPSRKSKSPSRRSLRSPSRKSRSPSRRSIVSPVRTSVRSPVRSPSRRSIVSPGRTSVRSPSRVLPRLSSSYVSGELKELDSEIVHARNELRRLESKRSSISQRNF